MTNKTTTEWVSAEELNSLNLFYSENKNAYEEIKNNIKSGIIKENELSVQDSNIYEQGKRYDYIQEKTEKQQIATEYCILEPSDSLYADNNGSKKKAQAARDLELYDYVVKEAASTNPKYDMVFIYDGIAYGESRTGKADYNPPGNDSKQVPYVYYDKMKRIKLDPWFLFSTHASLNSAMIKARELVNILGKDAVKIGKVVPIDQYIEIV